jgi:predicted O-methyltransferase YrrM
MKFNKIHCLLKGIPFITEKNARLLYDFIIANKLKNCLELGFAHGTASCYIAAAIDEIGEGSLVSVDLMEAENIFTPNIHGLLNKCGLQKYVTICREATGYNWFLHNEIAKNTGIDNVCKPKYDLAIIDGPKNWTIDSSAFFCVDKLLKPEGWIIFDDYAWTYAKVASNRDSTDGITHRSLSEDEKNTPHIKEIFNLLVMQHPSYSNFKVPLEGDWAWAQKIYLDTKKVSYKHSISLKDIFVSAALSSIKKIRKR